MKLSTIRIHEPGSESYQIDRVYFIDVSKNDITIKYIDYEDNKHMKILKNDLLEFLSIESLGENTELHGDYFKLKKDTKCGLISQDELIAEMFSIG